MAADYTCASGHCDLRHSVEDDGCPPFQQRRFAHLVIESRLGHHRGQTSSLLGTEVGRADPVVISRRGLHAFLYGAEADPVAEAARRFPVQVIEVTLALTVWVSLRSTSVKLSVPEAISVVPPAMSACGLPASAGSTGASLVPVMVMVTGCVELSP